MGHYKLRGYPESVVHSAWNKTKSVPRTQLLTIREEDEPPKEAPLVCITEYHPQNPPLEDILKKNWPTLAIDPKLNTISDKRVVFGHKRGKNLQDILVGSKISYLPTVRNLIATVINPTKVCNNFNCKYCPKLDHSGIVKSTSTKHKYIVPQRITCKFNNLIYPITCKVCQSQYVGQTMNSIQMSFQKHLNDISHCMDRSKAPPSAKTQGLTNLGLHFAQRPLCIRHSNQCP